ncbi:phosphatidate cytidylyltransferase [Burkholderia territorii]|uniref:phosphatidate cytidylyltransferase n=1 Tax=Burkholderia territorii TaxID=1503055 RepID=UPI000751B6AE|nr:phosphatidate cytidylyltransferase [Burkholderia territorii]KVL36650.1 phosphatidate cytidylyltransferase [Burkholderia territorii]KVQ44859.1 phosphatidate cytidylyltransferase [Burkholderia territorii]KWH13311.1 phosphatidate cytidylyltransferase [Burkholderia territorii]
MLKTRVITAVVMLAVLLPVTLFAPLAAFGALIGVVLVFAAWEWARLLKLGATGSIVYAIVAALALAATAPLGVEAASSRPLFMAAGVFWLLVGPFSLRRKPELAGRVWRPFLLAAGLVVFAASWHAVVAARAQGVPFVLSLLLVVWLADIGAYFAGKAFGKRKLAVTISPGKSWEGAIGGWLAVMVVASVAMAAHWFEPTLFSAFAARYGMSGAWAALTLLVVYSVIGDLFESLLKRQAGVKDSSGLLPGHGGVLDRVDALLPVLPLAMLLLG